MYSDCAYRSLPSFGEFIEKGLHLVDADSKVGGVAQPLPLGDALKDISEVVH